MEGAVRGAEGREWRGQLGERRGGSGGAVRGVEGRERRGQLGERRGGGS